MPAPREQKNTGFKDTMHPKRPVLGLQASLALFQAGEFSSNSRRPNAVWEIKDINGVFTAIELLGIAGVARHNITFTNFH